MHSFADGFPEWFTTDDLSEERLKVLWLEGHPAAVDQSDAGEESHDTVQVEQVQVSTEEETNSVTVPEEEGRGVDGEVGGGAAGESVEEKEGVGKRGEGEEGEVGGAKGDEEGGAKREDVGEANEQGVGGAKEDEGDEEGGVKREEVGGTKEDEEEEGGAEENGVPDEGNEDGGGRESEGTDIMAGFSEEPFVQAVDKFNRLQLPGVLELLTRAIDEGSVYCERVERAS